MTPAAPIRADGPGVKANFRRPIPITTRSIVVHCCAVDSEFPIGVIRGYAAGAANGRVAGAATGSATAS